MNSVKPTPPAPVQPESMSVLKHRLQRRSHRFTGPRQAVLEALRRQRRPVSVKEIHHALPPRCCDLATVYRSLHLLEQLAIVRRLDLGEGRARFELLPEGQDRHQHHLVCTRCQEAVLLDECFSSEWEQRIAADHGYREVTHRLEFFGLCPRCQ